MAKHPKVFNDLFVAMVRAGETGGNLEEVLERVAIQLEKDDNLRRTVRSAMVYPILIGVFAVPCSSGWCCSSSRSSPTCSQTSAASCRP